MAETIDPAAPELSEDRRRDGASRLSPLRLNKDRFGKRLVVLTMAALMFVPDSIRLVGLVEQENARDTFFLLRASQFGVVALMLAGVVA